MSDFAGNRRSTKPSSRDTQGPKLHAVIIGEPTAAQGAGSLGYPLSPLTPSKDLPFALLPICNTPLIDYILENLVENGVNEVTILLNHGSMADVQEHLSECRTARGKPWLSSDAIKVSLLEGARDISKLADAVREIRDRNVVSQSGSFLFVPIDAISFFRNLRGCFAEHLERVRTVDRYAATLLCTSSSQGLRHTLRDVLRRSLMEREEMSAAAAGEDLTSPLDRSSQARQFDCAVHTGSEASAMSHPPVPHTMFVLNNDTNVVTHMSRLEADGEVPEPALITFSRKTRQSVRMDLIPSGFVFVCCEALALVEFHIKDLYSFLSLSLLGQVDLYGNVFGVLEISQHDAVIEPVNSLEWLIKANLDVCARRLFPLTRESCFAEAQAKYAVSSSCETVYLHTTAKLLGQNVGPNVVLGENVCVPASANLAGTVCGANVVIGEESILVGCVLLDDAVVGKRCVLRGSVIGTGARIGDGAELANCIIGAHCVIGTHPAAAGAVSASGIVLHDEAIVCIRDGNIKPSDGVEASSGEETTSSDSDVSSSDHWLVGVDGVGRQVTDRAVVRIAPTRTLFTQDIIPNDEESDEESGDDEDDHEAFQRSIRSHVEVALLQPSRIEAVSYDMSTVCLSSGFGYPELCEVVTAMLVEHLLATHGARGVEATLEAARDLFGAWCRPFYNGFLSKNGDMNMDAMTATLEGLCSAICDPQCLLYAHAAEVMEVLYNDCDEDLYHERDYCIVSGEALVEFEAIMARRLVAVSQYSVGDDAEERFERSKITVAGMCHEFIMGVKHFLETEDEDEA